MYREGRLRLPFLLTINWEYVMSRKQIDALVVEWLQGDFSKRTSIQQRLKGSTALNALLDGISNRVAPVVVPS
jgi:hypothetical protein